MKFSNSLKVNLELLAAVLIISVLRIDTAKSAFLLYGVDFSSPPHTVGQPPVAGTGPAPRDKPTGIVFPGPEVTPSVGKLTSQPVKFTNRLDLSQLRFSISGRDGFSRVFTRYIIEMDVLVESLKGDTWDGCFTILLDTPQVRNIYFQPDKKIGIFVPHGPGGEIASYSFGVPVALSIDVNLETSQWAISIDESHVYYGPFLADGLKSFRVSLGDYKRVGNTAAIDNLKVYGIP